MALSGAGGFFRHPGLNWKFGAVNPPPLLFFKANMLWELACAASRRNTTLVGRLSIACQLVFNYADEGVRRLSPGELGSIDKETRCSRDPGLRSLLGVALDL